MPLRPLIATLSVTAALSVAAFAGVSPMPTPNLAFAQATSAAEIAPPPPLAAENSYLTNTETATFRGTIADFRAFGEENPVTDFVAVTDSIPPIVNITVLSGRWPEVGAVRRVDLEGGYHVHERVLENSANRFAYQLWDITAPSGRVVDHIKGSFDYTQTGDQVRVEWNYNIKPNLFLARPAIRRYLRRDFGPFMEAGLTGQVAAYQR